ncbi:hypothetical protein K488DRAFT_92060 [Vararia minispora EC-137]|uniref:Uncharacterized protein n=1 Tax=Vararia minispora EC-137 TaxID=1314806 RepID=A0ACB8Q4U3_9AGAM|nr:hypothetical protein K488DRAFT_92060 [Vararia minispora EC-137]
MHIYDFVPMLVDTLTMQDLEVFSYRSFDETGYHLAEERPPVLARFGAMSVFWTTTQMLAVVLNAHAQGAHACPPESVRTPGLDLVVLTQTLMDKLCTFLAARSFERVQIMNSRGILTADQRRTVVIFSVLHKSNCVLDDGGDSLVRAHRIASERIRDGIAR